MSVVFSKTYLIDSRCVDMFNQCKPSALLGFLQEAATGAAVDLNITAYHLRDKYNGMWVVTRISYWLKRPIRWNEHIKIETWHRGAKGAIVMRDFDLYDESGALIGEATSSWSIVDIDDYHLLRLGKMDEFTGTDGGERCKNIKLSKIVLPSDMEYSEERLLRYSETDINRHINNTRYADYVSDTIELEKLGSSKYISKVTIGFINQCYPGEVLTLEKSYDGNQYFVSGSTTNGQQKFDATICLENL